MFLSGIGSVIGIAGLALIVLFIIVKIKNSIESERRQKSIMKQQREWKEILAQASLESEQEEQRINDFNLEYSEEFIEEYILEFEDEQAAKKELLIKYSESSTVVAMYNETISESTTKEIDGNGGSIAGASLHQHASGTGVQTHGVSDHVLKFFHWLISSLSC